MPDPFSRDINPLDPFGQTLSTMLQGLIRAQSGYDDPDAVSGDLNFSGPQTIVQSTTGLIYTRVNDPDDPKYGQYIEVGSRITPVDDDPAEPVDGEAWVRTDGTSWQRLDGTTVLVGDVGGEAHAKLHAADHLTATDPITGGAKVENTTPSSFTTWASKTGDARKVIVWDDANGRAAWGYIQAYDVRTPAQILTFTITGDGAGDDALVGVQKLWGSDAGTWDAALTYEGTCTACSISESTGDGDYPDATFDVQWTSNLNMGAINSPAAVNGTVVFTATATVDGVSGLTKTVTIYYRNRRHWGPMASPAGDAVTTAEINALSDEELTNSRLKAWSDTLSNEYEWYCFPKRLGTATMWANGFEGGWEAPTTVSHTNDAGETEDYYCYRTTNLLTGTISFEAKA